MNGSITSPGQNLEVLKAKTKAFRFKKGQSGNPDGQSNFHHQARKLARDASPDMMRELIELAKTAEDERVRAVCLVAVLDRGGLRPVDQDPLPATKAPFNPRAYSPEELAIIEAALKLIKERRGDNKPETPGFGE
jgi:hypothetical protein